MIATLKNDKFTAQVDTFGAQLISLKDKNDMEFIWQRDPKFWDGCAPLLFPIVGRAVDGIITIDGKDFEMRLHGFACESAFEVVSQSDTLLVLMMKSTDVTKKSYPYDFEFYVTFVLDEQGLDTQLKVVNTDEKEMVFGIGGHPAISWPIFEGDTYDDYVIDFGSITELEALTCNEMLLESLNEQEKELFDKVKACYDEMIQITECQTFIKGFKLGARFTMTCFENEDDIFDE